MQNLSEAGKEIQIGGQAVIEGVVMRGPEKWALAVRRPSGDIFIEENPTRTIAERYPSLNHFLIRGIVVLIDSLIIGIKSMAVSANIALEEPEEPGPAEDTESGDEAIEVAGEPEKERKGALSTPEVAIALVIALALFLGLFIVVPTVITRYLQQYLSNDIVYNLVEGGFRVAIFLLYLVGIGFLPDVRRVFEYHGAEHKVVHAYEAGVPLDADAADHYSTAHVRCGTTFILIVLVISVLAFSLLGRPPLWQRIAYRLAIIPLVAAVSYEIIKLAGRWENSLVVRIIMAPGLWFQRLTTREPDEDQIEVAIDALTAAVGEDDAVLRAGATAG